MSWAVVTVFWLGHLRLAPGTWASALAVALAWPIHALGGFPLLAAATLALFLLGWWAAGVATEGMADRDPNEIVIDEVVGQWLALWPLSAGLWFAGAAAWTFPWPGWVGAFVCFRLFDVWKPWFIGRADRRGDALGTMLDDVLAGVTAAFFVALAAFVAHVVLLV